MREALTGARDSGAAGNISLLPKPAEEYVAPLDNDEVDAIAELVRKRTGLTAEAFYGPGN